MKKIKLTPLADKVIVQQAEAETKTASGIIIPDTAQEKPQKGHIVAVGKGTKENPITVKVGDVVLYGKYAGTELIMSINKSTISDKAVDHGLFLFHFSWQTTIKQMMAKNYSTWQQYLNHIIATIQL